MTSLDLVVDTGRGRSQESFDGGDDGVPAFYPKPPDEVTHKETHISHLFFAGDLVYKIKKAGSLFFSRLLDARQEALLSAGGTAVESAASAVGLPWRDADCVR